MGCSPVEALIQYRLQMAHRLLSEKTQTLQQISYACGFNSTNYFSRQFKKRYGYAPSQSDDMGKQCLNLAVLCLFTTSYDDIIGLRINCLVSKGVIMTKEKNYKKTLMPDTEKIAADLNGRTWEEF